MGAGIGAVLDGVGHVLGHTIKPVDDVAASTPFPRPLDPQGTAAGAQKLAGGPLYPLVRAILHLPFTRFDTPEVKQERRRQLDAVHRLVVEGKPLSSSVDTSPAREAFRQALIERMYGDGAAVKNRQAWVLIGMPACGKSTLETPLSQDNGALVVDGDEIRAGLPEIATRGGAYVEKEKVFVHDSVIERAARAGDNLVLSYAPNSPATVQRVLQELKGHGYQTHLYCLQLPVDKAIPRSIGRFEATGRLADPIGEYLSQDAPTAVYDALKGSRWVDEYRKYSTDVPRGAMPTLEEQGRNSP